MAKLLNANSMYLSMWELNRKSPHPKYVEFIIDYLGYTPKIASKFDKLGTRTKLYRLRHGMSLEEFLQMTNIDHDVIHRIENMRFTKLSKIEAKIIEKALKEIPNVSSLATL